MAAMQAGLQQAAFIIHDRHDDVIRRGIDVGLPGGSRNHADHLDEVARPAAGVERETIEQRLRDQRRTTELLGPELEQLGEERQSRAGSGRVMLVHDRLVDQRQDLEPRDSGHRRVVPQRERPG